MSEAHFISASELGKVGKPLSSLGKHMPKKMPSNHFLSIMQEKDSSIRVVLGRVQLSKKTKNVNKASMRRDW